MKYIIPFLALIFFSCSKDDSGSSNSNAGSYVVKTVILENCNPESNNVIVDFSDGVDCISNLEYEHCRSGKLIIAEDNTFTSTIGILRTSLFFNLTLPLFSITGQGTASEAGQTLNICIGNNCKEFVVDGNTYTHTYETVGCTNIIVLEKE